MRHVGVGIDLGTQKVTTLAAATAATDAMRFGQSDGLAQILRWNGSAWVTPSGGASIAGIPKIYTRKTGDPDPTGSMVTGDILIEQ